MAAGSIPDPIFVRDGNVYTSAGVTAGMEFALALVEEERGGARSRYAVARELVMFLRRPGGQSQYSAQLATQAADRQPDPRIASLDGPITSRAISRSRCSPGARR